MLSAVVSGMLKTKMSDGRGWKAERLMMRHVEYSVNGADSRKGHSGCSRKNSFNIVFDIFHKKALGKNDVGKNKWKNSSALFAVSPSSSRSPPSSGGLRSWRRWNHSYHVLLLSLYLYLQPNIIFRVFYDKRFYIMYVFLKICLFITLNQHYALEININLVLSFRLLFIFCCMNTPLYPFPLLIHSEVASECCHLMRLLLMMPVNAGSGPVARSAGLLGLIAGSLRPGDLGAFPPGDLAV